MKEFAEFGGSIWLALIKAVRTDMNVFLITCAGILIGLKPRLLRGIGVALFYYLTVRRVDDLMKANVKMKNREIRAYDEIINLLYQRMPYG